MKTKLPATSLIEALVASVIFMTIFMIAMVSLVSLTTAGIGFPGPVIIESEACICTEKFIRGNDTEHIFNYRWGEVRCTRKPFSNIPDIIQIDVTISIKGRKDMTYSLLEFYGNKPDTY